MRAPRRTAILVALGVVGILLYLVIVDLGVSAGRVHHGVRLGDLDLGGLTASEVKATLKQRARQMRRAPVEFRAEGLDVTLLPTEVNWRPEPERTATQAMEVGRAEGPLAALVTRVRCWLGGVDLRWAGHAGPVRVTRFIDEVERQAAARGLELDRARFRFKIKRGLRLWPRKVLRIPVREA